jgi:hypothetical protein
MNGITGRVQKLAWRSILIGSRSLPVPKGFWDPIESCFTVKQKPLIRGSLTRLLNKQKNNAKEPESSDFIEIKETVGKYRLRYNKEKEIVRQFNIALNNLNGIIENYYNRSSWERESIEAVHETYEEISKALSSIQFCDSGGGKKTKST